ncbi:MULTISPECIES: FAD-dependent oxidoreductase [Gordonia]|uniref:FAD-dependent oxidoreductase n=1 Tax=Gordonia amicalis TaxID=89053 RepID=A0ABU4D8F1_9ACTN|nr:MULTISPECIES: FAD-dependent oxidoreductase [Gordonia]ATD70717.1 protoporphyrinogen oxidase [Gordonia sp. 1D]MDV6306007.1 FAD-dependent oxidoreductase [Gordonia amicalis]
MSAGPRIAVVGGGVSGLTAAYRLRRELGADARIDVLEAGERLGGVLHTTTVGGQAVDVGAEAFIVRRPEALGLVDELGLGDRVVSPTGRRPAVWSGGRLHPLPTPALMGIPATPDAVAGLADPADVELIRTEPDRPWHWDLSADPTVGDLVTERFGPSVVARSVDPMLGGVYSSLAGDIGLREALPALAARLDAGVANLTDAVAGLVAEATGSGPVFGTLVGGYRVLLDALQQAAAVRPELCAHVRELEPTATGWTLHVGGTARDDVRDYDGVILAIPAWMAGHLLRRSLPDFAAPLRAVQGASSVVVSIALAPGTPLPDHSGVLVGTGESLRAKAFTLSSQKWAHLSHDDAPVSVRASFGRFGAPVPSVDDEPGVDDRLRTEALEDLDEVCRAAGVAPASPHVVDTYVQRWTDGLPVYGPGHLAAMARLAEARPRRLVLAGSSYAGVGVPACIGQAGRAVAALLTDLT